jgi:hypothetical protein
MAGRHEGAKRVDPPADLVVNPTDPSPTDLMGTAYMHASGTDMGPFTRLFQVLRARSTAKPCPTIRRRPPLPTASPIWSCSSHPPVLGGASMDRYRLIKPPCGSARAGLCARIPLMTSKPQERGPTEPHHAKR